MHPYLVPLPAIYEAHADPAEAGPMAAYMRNQFAFYGIKRPKRGALFKTWVAGHGLPEADDVDPIIRDLWALPQREYQYFGVALLDKLQRKLTPGHVPVIEYAIVTRAWWDTVDLLAARNIGGLFKKYPDARAEWIAQWRASDNLWLRRTALLHQLHYKAGTDAALLFELIRENLGSNEFFINKAIGWALREYSKTAPDAVIAFVEATELAPLSRREALKWLEKHG